MKLAPNPKAGIFDRGPELVFRATDGTARALTGESAELARAVLDFVTVPRARDEIFAHLAALVGGAVEPASVVDELLALFSECRVLIPVAAVPERNPKPRHGRRLVLGLTGAISTIHAPALVSRLLADGFDVEIALTKDARRFVSVIGLEALTHRRAYQSFWGRDRTRSVPHIQLAEWADIVLICPASATTIARIAQGDCSDLVAATAIATRAPVVIVPSMNMLMLGSASVRRNLQQLRDDGMVVARPGYGVEAARAPQDRTMVAGPTMSFDAVVGILSVVLQQRADRGPAASARGVYWERLYASTPTAELPWLTAEINPDLRSALDGLGVAGPALDVGTGIGTVAVELQRRGFEVTATDLAPTAIACARERAGGLPIHWVVDDALDSHVSGPFNIVHDRGCLHVLPTDRAAEYAAFLARVTARGGYLLIKTHPRAAAHSPLIDGTTGYSALTLATLLGDAFDLVRSEESHFYGPRGVTSAALFCVFRRRPQDG